MNRLTEPLCAVLRCIQEYTAARGVAPTVGEIARYCDASRPTTASRVARLKRIGYLTVDPPRRPRNLRIVPPERRPPVPVRPASRPDLRQEDFARVPLLGKVPAGRPILAEEDWEETLTLPKTLVGRGEVFALRVRGDSMIGAGIFDGDTAVIQKTPDLRNGEIGVLHLEDRVTLKRFYREGDRVRLVSENPHYGPIYCGGDVCILGRLKALLRAY